MGLFIRDDAVRELAERLAAARHTTVPEAVRRALERELDRERRIRESLARLDAMPRSGITSDHELYDDDGNPVL